MRNKLFWGCVLWLLLGLPFWAQVPLNGSSVSIKGNVVIPTTANGVHGNGTKVQYSDGTGGTGNIAVYDANGNVTDGGALITGTYAPGNLGPVAGNTCAPASSVTMTAVVPSGKTVAWAPVPGTAATNNPGLHLAISSISGSTVFMAVCNDWTYAQSGNPGSYVFTVVSGGSGGGGGGGSGSVNSVGLSLPAALFNVYGSPVTSTGTLVGNFAAVPTGYTVVGTGTSATVRQLTMDDILPAFNITSFTCSTSGTYEIGTSIGSPTNCSASYTTTPISATLSDSIGNPSITLTSPYASGSLPYSYTVTSTPINFFLSATGATNRTATQSIFGAAATFAGPGATTATGATVSGVNASLTGATGTLTRAGLGNQGSYSVTASGQKLYVLMVGGSHTFKDGSTGFLIPFKTPTAVSFTNQYGVIVSLYLYESMNTLTGNYTIQVAS